MKKCVRITEEFFNRVIVFDKPVNPVQSALFRKANGFNNKPVVTRRT